MNYTDREASLPNDDLLLVRVAADRVSLMEYRAGEWVEVQPCVTRETARALGCSQADIGYVFAGLVGSDEPDSSWATLFPEYQITHAVQDLIARGFEDTTVEADGCPSFTRDDLVVVFGNTIGQHRFVLQCWSDLGAGRDCDDWSCDDWSEFLVTLDDTLRQQGMAPADPQPIGCYTTGGESYFSWSPCDKCNCRLGGNRYDAIEVYDDESQYEVSICEDCAAECDG